MIAIILTEWLEFAVRWFHIITAIAWIGSSFYFIALDLGLKKNKSLPDGVIGEEWQVHGGGFYNIQKYSIAPPNLPKDLIWFKWESYSTWLSGFFLLAIVYYGGADIYLIDREIADINSYQAILISLVSILLGWIIYNSACKSPLGSNSNFLMLILFFFLIFLSWFYTSIFSGRAAFLHLGSITATLMTANVFFIIIPNQKIVVSDLKAGRKPDPKFGIIAKQRSTHNNYLTLPVIFFMLSNHYPLAFASELNWAIAPLVFLLGVSIRHYFNTYHATKKKLYWTWIITFLIFAAIVGLSSYKKNNLDLSENVNDLERIYSLEIAELNNEVHDIISARCTMCHAREPLWDGYLHAPKGFVIENKEDIKRYARQVYVQSALSKAMPPNNISYMEEIERFIIQYWYENKNKDD